MTYERTAHTPCIKLTHAARVRVSRWPGPNTCPVGMRRRPPTLPGVPSFLMLGRPNSFFMDTLASVSLHAAAAPFAGSLLLPARGAPAAAAALAGCLPLPASASLAAARGFISSLSLRAHGAHG